MAHSHYEIKNDELPMLMSDMVLNFGHASESWWQVWGGCPVFFPLQPIRV